MVCYELYGAAYPAVHTFVLVDACGMVFTPPNKGRYGITMQYGLGGKVIRSGYFLLVPRKSTVNDSTTSWWIF